MVEKQKHILPTINSFSCLLQFSLTTCRTHTCFLYLIDAWLRESGGLCASGPFQVYLQFWMSVNYPEPNGISKEFFTHLQRAWSLIACFLSNIGYWSLISSSKRKSVNVSWGLHIASQCAPFVSCDFTDLRHSFKNLLMKHLPLPEVILVLLGLSTTYFGNK